MKTTNTIQKTYRILCALILGYFLSGCTPSGPLFKPVEIIPESKSIIYLYRPEDRNNTDYLVKNNNEEICILKGNGYYPFLVDAGKVEISTSLKVNLFARGLLRGILDEAIAEPTRIIFKADEGKSYFLKCESETRRELKIELVPETFGIKNIKECRLLDSGL